MHVLRIIGMRLRISARSQMNEAIPEPMQSILDVLDGSEREEGGSVVSKQD